MIDKSKQLIIDFKNNGWQTPNLYERLFDLTSNSTDIFYFATEYLKSFDKNETIFNDILSYIDKSQFADLISSALDILKKQK
jgi:cephalosporin-C deacetylase-like acetyl esterase